MYYELQQLIPEKDSVDTILKNLAVQNNVQFWNYSNDTLSYDKKYFYNSMHLNTKGAEIFSKTLAKNIESYLLQNTLIK